VDRLPPSVTGKYSSARETGRHLPDPGRSRSLPAAGWTSPGDDTVDATLSAGDVTVPSSGDAVSVADTSNSRPPQAHRRLSACLSLCVLPAKAAEPIDDWPLTVPVDPPVRPPLHRTRHLAGQGGGGAASTIKQVGVDVDTGRGRSR